MVKRKKLRISILSLLIALIVALSAAAVALNSRGTAALAADRFIELDGNSVFYTAIHGAKIEATNPDDETEAATHFTLFRIGNKQTVSYRQNLAYKWISASGVEGGIPETRTLSMEIYFPEIAFKRYYIKFESQQYRLTEDGKSENYLVFTPAENNAKVQVSVTQTVEEDDNGGIKDFKDLVDIGDPVVKDAHVKIEFGNYTEGNYDVTVNGVNSVGALKNVYETFASYVASGDNAVTPLTFGALFTDEDKIDNEAQMALVDISGQSFAMKKDGSTYKVMDTASPVLCFSQTPSYLEYGKSISFQYRVIDVLASSPRATAYYYVLTGEQVKDNNFEYAKTDYDAETTDNEGEGEGEEKPASPFIKVSSSSSERIYPDENTFIPGKYLKSDVMGLVKIYYELSDVSSTSTAKTDKVFIDWYVDDAALEDVSQYNNQKLEGTKFLKLIKDKKGATYAQSENATYDEYISSVRDFESDYQTSINDAIEAMEDHKLYAGGNKFYLPSIEYGFLDEYLRGTDYKYSIYYKGASSGSHASLDSNKLAIDLNDADVTYRFTIYITDGFGNPMRYPDPDNAGEWKEIANNSTDIWDAVEDGLLPYFEFEVSYKEATAEPPENLSISYVQSNYSGVSFKITGVSGTYTSAYKLYVFDRNAYFAETQEVLDYDTFAANTQAIFDNTYKSGVNTRKFFTTVKPVSELLESDENYEKFKSLNWNATSISFTPQSVEDFYVIELQLTDNRSQKPEHYYATVASSVQTTPLKGESDWLGNNKTSIILFVVAGVCLVALIILLVIKPKDKGDIDAVYTEVESKDKKQKKEKGDK